MPLCGGQYPVSDYFDTSGIVDSQTMPGMLEMEADNRRGTSERVHVSLVSAVNDLSSP